MARWYLTQCALSDVFRQGFFVGRNEEKGVTAPHHHPAFDVDEDVLFHGTGIYAQFALDYLE